MLHYVTLVVLGMIALAILTLHASSFATWTKIRKVSALKTVKLVSLIPVVAFLLSFLFPFLASTIPPLYESVKLPAPNPVSISILHAQAQMYLFFFGLLLFSAAQSIYWLKCPAVIQQHGDCAAYIIKEHRVYDLDEYTLLYNALITRYPKLPYIYHDNRLEVLRKDSDRHHDESVKVSQMRLMYELLDQSDRAWAMSAVVLYSFGTVLVFSSSIEHIISAFIQLPRLLNTLGALGTY